MKHGAAVVWTARQKGAAAVFLAVVLVQVGLPLSRLAEPRPARFGWHMYSGVLEGIDYSVVVGTDTVVPVTLSDVVLNPRGEVAYSAHLVEHLCRTMNGAVAVRLESRTVETEVIPCE